MNNQHKDITKNSGIRDNHYFGKVGDFLNEKIQSHANLRFVSAYFSIFRFEALRESLSEIDKLRFLFGDQQQPFIELVDKILVDKKEGQDTSALELEIDGLVYGLYGLSDEEILIVEGK
ncbi:MAG: hypothetical protein NTZ45_08980 [Methylococcales bacterium]|nr:hypothetical protein [Methylococcales bacterium]